MQVVVVETKSQWQKFFALRREVYRDDPAAVFPLNKMDRQMLDPKRHPFYRHATREAFICSDATGKVVGRIAAIKDTMHNEHHDDQVGFMGFFEVIDHGDAEKITGLLVEAAEQWLKENGCDRIRGPMNPSMKAEFGVVVEGNQYSPSVMLAHTPKNYAALLASAGFSVVQKFNAYRLFMDKFDTSKWDNLIAFCDKTAKRFPDLEFRTVNPETFAQTFRDINNLGNEVRSEGWGFVPLTDEELDFMINNLRRVIRFDTIHVAYIKDELVGYIVNIPDVNWALKKSIGKWDWIRLPQLLYWLKRTPRTRVIALGVKEKYRKCGVSMTLIRRLIDVSTDYNEWEFSWVQHDNIKSIRAIARTTDLELFRTFEVYEKAIL
jgi:GNAT superfamily N-acetyltransferase